MNGKLALFILIAASVLLTGCKKDAEVQTALSEVDAFTTELVRFVESAQTPSAGIDDAQAYMDRNKRDIKTKAVFLARIRGLQVSEETKKRMIETVKRNQTTVTGLQNKYMSMSMSDPAFRTKLDKLVSDYLELFQA